MCRGFFACRLSGQSNQRFLLFIGIVGSDYDSNDGSVPSKAVSNTRKTLRAGQIMA